MKKLTKTLYVLAFVLMCTAFIALNAYKRIDFFNDKPLPIVEVILIVLIFVAVVPFAVWLKEMLKKEKKN